MNARIEPDMVTAAENRCAARIDRRLDLLDDCYTQLRDELIDALMNDPARRVRTPGWADRHAPAASVILDDFAAHDGEAMLHELLRIVGACAAGKFDAELHLRASAWIAARAAAHARFHQDDLALQIEDGGGA